MKRKKTPHQDIPCPDYTILLPKSLADLLHQKQDDRYTKYEAFRYLIEKQAIASLGIETDNAASGNAPCMMTTTITQLSEDWGWHRHTVKAFLEELASLQVLRLTKGSDGYNLCFCASLFPSIV